MCFQPPLLGFIKVPALQTFIGFHHFDLALYFLLKHGMVKGPAAFIQCAKQAAQYVATLAVGWPDTRINYF